MAPLAQGAWTRVKVTCLRGTVVAELRPGAGAQLGRLLQGWLGSCAPLHQGSPPPRVSEWASLMSSVGVGGVGGHEQPG